MAGYTLDVLQAPCYLLVNCCLACCFDIVMMCSCVEKVLMITDGRASIGEGCFDHLPRDHSTTTKNAVLERLPFELHVICVASSGDPSLSVMEPQFRQLVSRCTHGGQVHVPEGTLCERSVQQMFTTIADQHYTSFTGTLRCGNLRCPIQIFPAPEVYDRLAVHDY